MNPITPEDLFSSDFSTRIDEIVSRLEQALTNITGKIEDVKKRAGELNSAPMGSGEDPAKKTKEWAGAVGQLSDEYKALLQEYGIYKTEIAQVTSVARDQNVILKLQSQYAESAEGSYNKLSAEYRLLKVAMNEMGTVEEGEIKRLEIMKKRAAELYEQMNKYQKETGKYTLQVGDYSRALNGLTLSTQQVLREMPTLANSLQQFFIAISNNVPIFVDNFNRVRQEMGSTKAAILGTLKAIASWQTVLLVVLTILPKVAKAIHDKRKAQEENNKAVHESVNLENLWVEGLKKIGAAEAKVASDIKTLYSITKDLNRTEEERTLALNKLNELYPEASGNIEEYIKRLELEAKAKAVLAEISDLRIQLIKKEIEAESRTKGAEELQNELDVARAAKAKAAAQAREDVEIYGQTTNKTAAAIVAAEKAIKKSEQALADYNEQTGLANNDIEKLKKGISDWENILSQDLIQTLNKTTKSVKDAYSGTEISVTDYIISLYQAQVDGMEDGIEKAIVQNELNRIKLEKSYQKDYDILTEQEKKAEEQKNSEVLAEIRRQMEIRRALYEQELANLPTDVDIAKKYAKAMGSDPLAEVRRAYADASKNLVSYSDKIQQGIDSGRKIGAAELADWQNVIRQKIQAESDYQKAKKELELKGKLDAGTISQQEYEDLLAIETAKIESAAGKALDKVGKARSKKKFSLWTALFGTNVKDESSGTITKVLGEDTKFALDQVVGSFKTGISYIQEYISSLQELAQQAIETAETQAEAARTELEIEQTARANGYANNVELARKEYEEKLALQRDAEKQAAELQKAQEAINTATQVSSLVTATAGLLSSYSAIPIIGLPLALAAIATMWGAFTAAKVKAAQVAGTKTYGEGMSEYLDYGGSHSSGNDIDFGVMKDGTRRRVERGEVVGVINKRNVAKYGASTVTGIIDSLNKGTFQNKYGNAFAGVAMMSAPGAPSLAKLESGVDTLIRQGNYRETVVGDKRIVQYKNLRRVITNA